MRIVLISLIASCFLSCSQKKNIASAAPDISSNTKPEMLTNKNYDNTCFEDRSMTKEVDGQIATIINVMDMYMFSFESTRWQACSVPEEFQVEGMKVKVSGEVLEIRPNERRAGTPFKITKLEKM